MPATQDARRQAAQTAALSVSQNGGNAAQQNAAANAAGAAVDLMSNGAASSSDSAAQLAQIAATHPEAFQAALVVVRGDGAQWENDSRMNPIGGPKRRKEYPVRILGASQTTDSNGNAQLVWQPQNEVEAFRFVIPSGQPSIAGDTGYISQLAAGDRLMQAQSGRSPASVFAETTDCGRIDFPITKLGQTISCQFSGGVAAKEISAVLLAYSRGKGRRLPPGAEFLQERLEPFDVVSVPALGVASIVLAPQRNLVLRRIAFDSSVANFANLYVTSINVQDDPQFGTNYEIPASMFNMLAQDDWLDFDLCQIGGTITINMRNSHATLAVNAQGTALADVIRLPGDAR